MPHQKNDYTGADRTAAAAMFDGKLPSLQRIVEYRCSKRGIGHELAEEIEQLAGLYLWTQCLKLAIPGGEQFEISCEVVFVCAFAAWARRRHHERRICSMADLPDLDIDLPEPAAHEPTIKVDGVVYNLADAMLDDRGQADVIATGISADELAERLGCTRQNVMRNPGRHGAVSVPGRQHRRWFFPKTAGTA